MRLGPAVLKVSRQLSTAVTRLAQENGYGVNLPGRGYGDPSKPLGASELRQTFGAVGTPIIAGIIPQDGDPSALVGDRGIDTYERMWKTDGQCAALMNVYLLPLLQATYSIQAASDDPDDVTIAQETSDNLLHGMSGMTWHRFLRQLYLFRGLYGHYVGEKCWTVDDAGKIRLRKLAPRLPRTLYRWLPDADDNLDRIMQRVWVVDPNGITGKYEFPVIPAQKLLVSTRSQIGNDYRGVSLMRPCYKHWFYKDQLYAIDGVAAAKNAMGVPTLTEPAQPDVTRQASDRTIAANALAAYQVNERAYFLVPAGWTFDLKAVSGAVKNVLPSIEHHDLLMARSFLAQFINLDSGGTLIAARDSSAFFLEMLTGEADEVSDDLNPVIREMEEYNHPRDRYSSLQMQGLDQRDLDQYLRGLAALVSAKVINPDPGLEDWMRDYIDAPPRPQAKGAGTGGVDSTSQGTQSGEGAGEAAERQQAAGIDQDPAEGDAELSRWVDLNRRMGLGETVTLAEWNAAAETLQRAARPAPPPDDLLKPSIVTSQTLALDRAVSALARQTIQRRSAQGYVTIPRADGSVTELRRFGGRWETYARRPSAWAGYGPGTLRLGGPRFPKPGSLDDIDLPTPQAPPTQRAPKSKSQAQRSRGAGTPVKARSLVSETWHLGSGGVSGKHCPQCVELAEGSPYEPGTLPTRPRKGDTYCEDACTCFVTKDYREE